MLGFIRVLVLLGMGSENWNAGMNSFSECKWND